MNKNEYFYELPDNLIALEPLEDRSSSKLVVLKNKTTKIHNFRDIYNLFDENSLIVFNETKVFPARIYMQKDSGVGIEIFLLKDCGNNRWYCLSKGLNTKKKKHTLYVKNFPVRINILEKKDQELLIKFDQNMKKLAYDIGETPIPPYLKRKASNKDKKSYQSVFANDKYDSSSAAPTASLHFDNELMKHIKNKHDICFITLSVGLGTFKPLPDGILDNVDTLHKEDYFISKKSSILINEALKNNRPIIAIGTTVLRALESSYNETLKLVNHGNSSTDLFIKEGFKFKVVDQLVTNFHLPESSLLMLVSAFGGKENILKTYDEAIRNKLRFYSYGDAMYIKECLSK